MLQFTFKFTCKFTCIFILTFTFKLLIILIPFTVFRPGCVIAPFTHIFMFLCRKNKFLHNPGTENLLQYYQLFWSVAFTCGSVQFTINWHRNYFKMQRKLKIHLNRQSGMIFACSLCIFDVISSIGGSLFFLFLLWLLVQCSCSDYWFNAHL